MESKVFAIKMQMWICVIYAIEFQFRSKERERCMTELLYAIVGSKSVHKGSLPFISTPQLSMTAAAAEATSKQC